MTKQITDRQMFQAAMRKLHTHLATRTMTKAECAAEVAKLQAAAGAAAERAEQAALPIYENGQVIWVPHQEVMEAKAAADRAALQARAYEDILDSPLHAYHQTTLALANRVAYYAAKAGIQ